MRGRESRPLLGTIALLVATAVCGLVLRFAPLGLPYFFVKYGGSTMWALMIYWLVTLLRPRWLVERCALAAGVVATAVEFFKLYHSPAMDAFRLTLPGVILLGRYFSVWDIVAYWVAIAAGAWLDMRLRRAPLQGRLE